MFLYGDKTSMVSRRALLAGAGFALIRSFFGFPAQATGTRPPDFDFLSTHGNSNCSKEFLDSIGSMPPDARLQGSCCAPMEKTRYERQIEGLKIFASNVDIPPNPYDMEAGLASKLLGSYDLTLNPEEQKAYDYAMANSDEQGPCCCRCWRWKVYGGLGKLLIREHGFDGKQVKEVWNLSNGCGGAG